MNEPRGSLWKKWDLHVHTPESVFNNYSGPESWEKFIRELEELPPEFKVIGINDYIFLDGYKRILVEKSNGRLANIELFLPVIELRLDKFGGSAGHLSRVNYHIIFSSEITPDLIEHQFLNALYTQYILLPQHDYLRTEGKWAALPTKQSIEELGRLIIASVPTEERSRFGTPLIEGFNNLCFSLDNIRKVLELPYFKEKAVTAVGKTEWADIKWNDHSIAEKKTIINGTDLVFISAETIDHWQAAKDSLTNGGVNDRLLDCSDAHSFRDATCKDKIGKCFTWIKADTTFEGLLQVLNEPRERIFVGEIPPKLLHVRSNKTKYIKSIQIERKPQATLTETWFNNKIEINTDLVAIIGNKGKGKSALTDIIGLLCNTKQHQDFTFLSQDNFRQPKENKARHFQATLTWESNRSITKGLDESADARQPELVKYIPQNFLEKICIQLGRIEETDFDFELKKVVFSHVEVPDRLGKATLDELISYKTSEANAKIQILKQELSHINEGIVALEEQNQPEYRLTIQNLLDQKQRELEAHEQSKPTEVPKPENDPVTQRAIAEVATAIEDAKGQLAIYDKQVALINGELAEHAQLISIADKLIARIENLQRQLKAFMEESRSDLQAIGFSAKDILTISINKQPLIDKRKEFHDKKIAAENKLDPSQIDSFAYKKIKIIEQIEQLQDKLDEPNKNYQGYITELEAWEKKKNDIIGNENIQNTIKFYEKQLENLAAIPGKLGEARTLRLTKSKEIHEVIRHLADSYRELYAPVHNFIEKRPLAKDKFQLNFEVDIVDTGFKEGFFDIVSQRASGTFCGIEEGHKILNSILLKHDFNTSAGIEAFLVEITDSLENDKRPGGKPIRMADQIRKHKSILDLYNMIFSLDYLKPRYALRMDDKELHQLSPGERGALLLIFYLLLDKDDIPLIIDQPEENLDNQTVYELLVPCMKDAKQRRQIVIVTHNPNLAVVCDAEQVICADLDKKSNYQMNYISGAIENPTINKAIVDILEGTMPAFSNREAKYLEKML
jgi:ABC-type lipoprotein export system ATPase subunit